MRLDFVPRAVFEVLCRSKWYEAVSVAAENGEFSACKNRHAAAPGLVETGQTLHFELVELDAVRHRRPALPGGGRAGGQHHKGECQQFAHTQI